VIEIKSVLFALVIISCLFSIVEAQSNPHYMTTDPAIREMLISMDMPRYVGSVPPEIIAGTWLLNLSGGEHIELALQQSVAAIFGKGTLTNSTFSQVAFASGSVSGSKLNLEVVPEMATELYATYIDISRLPYEGTYVVFLPDSRLHTGTISAQKDTTNG
jgi:hypothetical protein